MRTRSIAFLTAVLLGSPLAVSANCTIDLASDDMMRFDQASVTVSASCPTITLNLKHTGKLEAKVMGHNAVIAPSDVWQAAAQDGLKAGLENDYVVPDDARVVAHTKVIGGGESTSISFPGNALKAGTPYMFFCSFPGHWAIMKGELQVVE